MLLSADLGALLLRRLIDCTDFGAYLLLSADLAALAYVGLAQIGDIGLTDPEFPLKVIDVMRPCDGTSGLVRGNRRKAVFAFKGSKWINHLNLSTSRLLFLKAVDSNAITILG